MHRIALWARCFAPRPRLVTGNAAMGALRALAALVVLCVAAIAVPTAGAIVGGTDQIAPGLAAPVAYIEIETPTGTAACTGTLISPTVVMTAAHCVYETSARENLLGIARPSDISVRVGSTNVLDASLGVAAGVIAVLPQPYYRWDGGRHFHDVALLALDRRMPQTPATLAEQTPAAGESLLIAGQRRRRRHRQLRITLRLRVLALVPRARVERARLHRSSARHRAGSLEHAA